ncbi:MAG: MoaD/ThiS family protein [candidate division KSB1 bacterium]|jgi:sulfur carrier protein ThiS|nr:MoaD/ThiS family protein [candidate division KSB1 bacterium]
MIRIELQLHGELKRHCDDQSKLEMTLEEGCSVKQLIGKSGVPAEEIAFAAVNGSRVPVDHVIEDGDRVKLFQFVAGG